MALTGLSDPGVLFLPIVVADNLFTITGSVDATKTIKFEADAQSTGADLTINSGAQTADRNLTVPVLTADATLAVLSETQTFSGTKTFSTTIIGLSDFALQSATPTFTVGDGTGSPILRILGSNAGQAEFRFYNNSTQGYSIYRPGGTTGLNFYQLGTANIDVLTLSASGDVAIGKTTGTTLAVSSTTDSTTKDTGSIVTEGGIGVEKAIVAGTNITAGGALNVTGNSTLSGNQTLIGGNAVSSPTVIVNGAVSTTRGIVFQTAGSNRAIFYIDATAESGGSVGSAFTVGVYNDAGSLIDTPFSIARPNSGAVTIGGTSRVVSLPGTTNATSVSAAAVLASGGLAVTKNIIGAMGRGAGVTSTATLAGTVTLTATSNEIQKFTGATAGTVVQFPAANLFGAGIAVLFTINNQSTQTVTPTRAGADTFPAAATTDPVLAGASMDYASDGVSLWMKK